MIGSSRSCAETWRLCISAAVKWHGSRGAAAVTIGNGGMRSNCAFAGTDQGSGQHVAPYSKEVSLPDRSSPEEGVEEECLSRLCCCDSAGLKPRTGPNVSTFGIARALY